MRIDRARTVRITTTLSEHDAEHDAHFVSELSIIKMEKQVKRPGQIVFGWFLVGFDRRQR